MPKKKWTEEERHELIRKLNADLEEFIEECAKKPNKSLPSDDLIGKSTEEIWAEFQKHPAFMTDFDPSKPLSPEMQGLIDLKYNTDDAEDKADSYREDGNINFKNKKYRWAVDAYTEGMKAKCRNKELNAILYSNRAAAHFYLENYRSALNDCAFARKFKPDHLKAIVKGAQCCIEIKRYDQAMKWCDSALLIEPEDTKILEMRSKGDKLKRAQERDRRKEQAQERKELAAERKLLETIQARGVRIAGVDKAADTTRLDTLLLSSLEAHQNPSGVKVHLNQEGALCWPVMFLYPEYRETDFISSFNENDRLCDHIEHMFGPETEPPPWDTDHKYTPCRLEVYFEDKEKEKLVKVKKTCTLSEVLQDERYVVYGGTPGFILLVKDSAFAKDFLHKYSS